MTSYVTFLSYLFIAAFVGLFAGTLIDKMIDAIAIDCALLVMLEVFIVITLLYVLFRIAKYRGGDDMILGFSGFIFALTFFASLPTLAANIACSVN